MRKMKENACNNKNQKKNPGFLLSAVSSNSGKTAAACGLMSAFKQEANIRECSKYHAWCSKTSLFCGL